MDLQNETGPLFSVMGTTVTIEDIDIVALVDLPPKITGPWSDESQPAPMMTVRKDDLTDNDLWPLDNPEIIIDEVTYRAIASSTREGLVEIYMQEG